MLTLRVDLDRIPGTANTQLHLQSGHHSVVIIVVIIVVKMSGIVFAVLSAQIWQKKN